MCSVTFWPNSGGYLLGMNRDEQRARVAGLPPARFIEDGRVAVHPLEPNGGSWASLNDSGVGFALINWYAIRRRAPRPAVSRGDVIVAVRAVDTPEQTADRLAKLPLSRINAFRLIGAFPRRQMVREWRWDLETLGEWNHDWSPNQWCSSGFDEPTAQRVRGATFAAMKSQPDVGTLAWLRRLHGSHEPECGPFSVCMHRTDAETVSYTEWEVGEDQSILRYGASAPCRLGETLAAEILPRGRSR